MPLSGRGPWLPGLFALAAVALVAVSATIQFVATTCNEAGAATRAAPTHIVGLSLFYIWFAALAGWQVISCRPISGWSRPELGTLDWHSKRVPVWHLLLLAIVSTVLLINAISSIAYAARVVATAAPGSDLWVQSLSGIGKVTGTMSMACTVWCLVLFRNWYASALASVLRDDPRFAGRVTSTGAC